MIGLGRMGMNMSLRLLNGGHQVVAFDINPENVQAIEEKGATAVYTLEDLVRTLTPVRILWMMLPAGRPTEQTVFTLNELLDPEDILIDGGNSYYKNDVFYASKFKEKGIRYLDAGVSGGIWGLQEGYCLMVGGERDAFEYVKPILECLAPVDGYMYCGSSGAGHFVKMVHNGIEYAMMEAYGEGFDLLKNSPYGKELNLAKIARLWNRGSVIRSWLLELLENIFSRDPELDEIKGYVEDTGEGRWTVKEAVDYGVAADVIALSLFKRFQSRQPAIFSNKVLAALRREFGGHAVEKKDDVSGATNES